MVTKTDESAKRGKGRPPIVQGEATVVVPVRMTSPQRDKLGRLGGAKWVRQKIDKARDPEDPAA